MEQWNIRQKYIDMVERYNAEKNSSATKTMMKYKFRDWIIENQCMLTEAEREYLQQNIMFVEDLYY